MRGQKFAIQLLIAALAVFATAACGGESAGPPGGTNDADAGGDYQPPTDDGDLGEPQPPQPEVPETYTYSQPAIVGDKVYVANETLDAVAIIDSRSLEIQAVPVGRAPTKVVAPADGAGDDARVMVLNSGDHTVSLLDPEGGESLHVPVMPHANRLQATASGRFGVAWYDSSEPGPAGDLSAVTVVSSAGSFDVAVGFLVRQVLFDEVGERALVVSDDGVSVLDLAAIESDRFVAPRPLTPPGFEAVDPAELRLHLGPQGDTLVAWTPSQPFLFVSDLSEDTRVAIALGAPPTGAALSEATLVFALSEADRLLTITLPEGLEAARADQEARGLWVDGAFVPPLAEDAFVDSEGFVYLSIEVPALGSVVLSEDASVAMAFTTNPQEQRAVLVAMAGLEQRTVRFEKEVRGVLADEDGSTFLVIHPRRPGSREGLTPSDPEFVERSHGFSVLDIGTAQTRLVLTELEIARAVLFAPDTGDAFVYLSYENPQPGAAELVAHREIVRVNLGTFRSEVMRLSALPDAMGLIPGSGRVYVNQVHPQGRITFVEAATGERQTVTGYQLNSGIF
ncbi:hypothetical protein FRC98_14615 [Lujinxingia vulgaris]|uniref:YncE family protein n=1 Tax=Lujinxingia vulgaris TaxID=2600176 RepID=A0A5C6X835_9DELT|nr:hypothetical protein [Lujinxingia vulgaris]TXD35900.1 hypothetical protein FRC98_14615 [Lujinxingia vulgaris]